ncbi:hypothetical protein LPJ61_001669 [Coemansia biformis]|uniref:PI31 proteasome regulator C-terminal domain-containing protein n=1 Tax=Coemansia biformis TaxID=1286918 RepID=A0A9W7YFZ1_9FUNG|nr:hypothetical protein LPJ61_001669 [Coemansia biformis]
MQADSDDIVATAVHELLGDSPVQSAEDLVVALSLAVLGRLGFEPSERGAAWAPPGLPQGQHAAQLTYVNGSSEGEMVEAKWVAMGANVMLLVRPLAAGDGDVCSIQLPISALVAPTARFPCAVQDAGGVEALLAPDAVALATASIRNKLIDGTGPARSETLRAAPVAPAAPAAPEVPAAPLQLHPRPANRGTFPGVPSVGRGDLDPLDLTRGDFDEAGMLFGPGHPMFRQGGPPSSQNILPPGAVPPGARFDPIAPPLPGRGRGRDRFASGEPNPDAAGPPDSSWNFDI